MMPLNRIRGEWFEGERVPQFLRYVAELAEKMVDAHDGGPNAPHYADVDSGRLARKRDSDITVRFVPPSPKTDPAEAAMLREGMQGYIAPSHPVARERISPPSGSGAFTRS
jgi:hypothetical protein